MDKYQDSLLPRESKQSFRLDTLRNANMSRTFPAPSWVPPESRSASCPPNTSNNLMEDLACGDVRKYRVENPCDWQLTATGGKRKMIHPGRVLPTVLNSSQALFGTSPNKCGGSATLKVLSTGVPVQAPRYLTHDVFSMNSSAFSNFRMTSKRFQPAQPTRTVSRGHQTDNMAKFEQHTYVGPHAVYTGSSAVRPGYTPSAMAQQTHRVEGRTRDRKVLNARSGRTRGPPTSIPILGESVSPWPR